MHALAQAINHQGKLVPFSTLTDSFDFRALEPSLQAASMVQYIYEIDGVTALKAFWAQGLENAQNIIGLSAAELEKRWTIHIQQEKYTEYQLAGNQK